MTVSMSAVWDRTSEFLGDHRNAVAGIAGLAIFAPSVVTEMLSPTAATAGAGLRLGLGLVSLVAGIVTLWGQMAIIAMAIGVAPDAAAARSLAGRRLGPMILVVIAMMAVMLLLTLPIVVTLVADGVDLTRLNQSDAMASFSPAAAGFVGLYSLVLVPLCLWLVARYAMLATPVVLAENQALGALGRAFRLSRGLVWKIIGVLVLYIVVASVAWMAAVTVFGALFSFLLGGDGAFSLGAILVALVSALVSTVFTVIAAAFAGKLYRAVRDREDVAPA